MYRDRILRGTGPGGYYSMHELGAFGTNLGAVACFFEEPWKKLAPGLSEPDQAWLLAVAAFNLRALGRLAESGEPMRTALPAAIRLADWKNAAIRANNRSELELTLGELAAGVRDAQQSVELADRSGAFERMSNRTALADARHQSGAPADALALFREAEAMQQQREPEYRLLYSLPGSRYCDLLLGDAERTAWSTIVAPSFAATDRATLAPPFDALREVEQRAALSLKWVTPENWLLDIALDHLTLGRVALYRAILERSSFEPSHDSLTAAVGGLRTAGDLTRVPRGLLTRAWLRFLDRDPAGATADLDEAWQIAERGSMKLHMADILLYRARLFRDRAALEAAARLIVETGYHRRDDELADAREALKTRAG